MNYTESARLFRALSDPIRVEVMTLLTTEKRCACQLLERFPISQPTLSHHMNVLVESGLVVSERRGKWIFYGIDPDAVARIMEYVDAIGTVAPECTACGA
ncbi:MAG: metalloregulator ArsR/SmtB family transcription factor [Candidatus Izemoplasmatales bacterium]